MSSQDHLERILFAAAKRHELIDLRFGVRAEDLIQDREGCRSTLRDLATGEESDIAASYVIAADGVRSSTRDRIDCPLSGDRLDVYFQDVLFHADLSKWIGERIAGLHFIAHADTGGAVFQPLDGKTRWRCQIGNFPRDEEITEAYCIEWIKTAVGTRENFDIRIESISPWRFIAATADRFSSGRVFLAGDAAHAFIPAGALGSNTGIVGIRNLTWKIAYVVRGVAPASLLDTYDAEHRPLAATRIQTSYVNAMLAAAIFEAHQNGGNVEEAARNCRQYAEYEGLILGYELSSWLCRAEDHGPPRVENPIKDFVPVVRNGRRAPYVWQDAACTCSTVDWFTTDYVVVDCDAEPSDRLSSATERMTGEGFPVRYERLEGAKGSPYEREAAVLVRPDGITAAHLRIGDPTDPHRWLEECLPIAR